MTDKTHQILGLTAATAGFFALHPEADLTSAAAGTILFGAFFGSLMPDIDQPTSHFWDSVPLGRYVGRLAPQALGGHRNLSHSMLGYFLFVWLAGWVVTTFIRPDTFLDHALFLESFKIGFIAHLAADAVTVQGIPIFWPLGPNLGIPPWPLQGLRIVTGKWFENLVVFPVSVVALGLVLVTHTDRLCALAPLVCR
ncbi:metal-dependent hydrolase [Candidatus Berkelbacteria bacterium]|nr:metal-dependent hydrolase [Candidatus Berkelbacteria bacterium]